jgi:hypothetical protein
MNAITQADRNTLVHRAEALNWPLVVLDGTTLQGEARWRTAVRLAQPFHFAQLSEQLPDLEAAHARDLRRESSEAEREHDREQPDAFEAIADEVLAESARVYAADQKLEPYREIGRVIAAELKK